MKFKALMEDYIRFKQALGEDFRTNETRLKSFYRSLNGDPELEEISPEMVESFIYGSAPLTSFFHAKYHALKGFYHYALSRGYIRQNPLPRQVPKRLANFVPYIYSHEELKSLLEAIGSPRKGWKYFDPDMIRMVLLLTYAMGLRVSEALSLKMKDVNLQEEVILIENTKFFKTRLLPISSQISQQLRQYVQWRIEKGYSQESEAPFFVGKANRPLSWAALSYRFKITREKVGIRRSDGARYQPRLHDFRHTFAVHRLLSWYQQGEDVQKAFTLAFCLYGTCLSGGNLSLSFYDPTTPSRSFPPI